MLEMLTQHQISFFSFSKPDLYAHWYAQGWVPRYVVLYIGQKSNVWLWDCQSGRKVRSFKKSEFDVLGLAREEVCLDYIYEEGYFDSAY